VVTSPAPGIVSVAVDGRMVTDTVAVVLSPGAVTVVILPSPGMVSVVVILSPGSVTVVMAPGTVIAD
jgi:hypothetical protein